MMVYFKLMLVKCSLIMVKCSSMEKKWVYDHTLISPSLDERIDSTWNIFKYNVCLEKGSYHLIMCRGIDRYSYSVTISWSEPFSRNILYIKQVSTLYLSIFNLIPWLPKKPSFFHMYVCYTPLQSVHFLSAIEMS